MPLTITEGNYSSSFVYGPEHQRTVQTRGDMTLLYADGMEIDVPNAGGSNTIKTYWPGDLGLETTTGGAPVYNWTHGDNLGSVVAITDINGNLVQQMAYDPWGARRDLQGDPGVISAATGTLSGQALIDNKGFTHQEELDQLGLVHLNGRVYDPFTGRFMSADPDVQDPYHSQSYNRYTYVWNNPSNLTDPTGFQTTDGCGTGCDIIHVNDNYDQEQQRNVTKTIVQPGPSGKGDDTGKSSTVPGAGNAQTNKAPCQGLTQCVTTDDKHFDPNRSNNVTAVASKDVEKAMIDNKQLVAVGEGQNNGREKLGFVVKSTDDGQDSYSVVIPGEIKKGRDDTHDTAAAPVPPNSVAVLHGHVDGQQEGVTSDGDAAPLLSKVLPRPNGVVSEGRVGVTELVGGRLRFRMLEGEMRADESKDMQFNLNQQQKEFDKQ